MTPYHVLITRENVGEKWGVEFGDYELGIVCDERDDLTDIAARNKRIITLNSDNQADIEGAIADINSNPQNAK